MAPAFMQFSVAREAVWPCGPGWPWAGDPSMPSKVVFKRVNTDLSKNYSKSFFVSFLKKNVVVGVHCDIYTSS
jgi:hypothetical protein